MIEELFNNFEHIEHGGNGGSFVAIIMQLSSSHSHSDEICFLLAGEELSDENSQDGVTFSLPEY